MPEDLQRRSAERNWNWLQYMLCIHFGEQRGKEVQKKCDSYGVAPDDD